ncbi:hypothetical protein IQ265_20760 [Nodosilinea sp. LEGE 06152]|uniref:hypothetical protein n=1 Tax=Nodosilinea sp. LEGE 06152 TaxID=2777966 RepID=UPI001882146D|nr:hypothetical protein [Nodosilinea sp. LEGE 06152]MBE9159247.1 hypothetical protein [Nodosilinea sp. LEGE 06152]
MIPWLRTVGFGLGLVAASSLWTVAQASPAQEAVEPSPLIQVDDVQLEDGQVNGVMDEPTAEILTEVMPISAADSSDPAAEAPIEALAAEVTPVPTEVLENLSPGQIEAIATIISTAEASASTGTMANLPTEVLAQLDTLAGLEQPVGRRRWLPTSLVRRLRLPQMIASLVRQPKNTALVMLGNHIVVVNPATGAVLGAVLSAL